MHNFSLPTETEMETLITQLYESRPGPDQSRLSLIESKLLQQVKKNKPQKNLNKIPWWIVLLLAGSFATAAWQIGKLFPDKQGMEIKDKPTVSDDKIIQRETKTHDTDANRQNIRNDNEAYDDRESPVIYQRESF